MCQSSDIFVISPSRYQDIKHLHQQMLTTEKQSKIQPTLFHYFKNLWKWICVLYCAQHYMMLERAQHFHKHLLCTYMVDWLSNAGPGRSFCQILLEWTWHFLGTKTPLPATHNICEDSVSMYFYFSHPLTDVNISLVWMVKGYIFIPFNNSLLCTDI